MMAGKPWSTIEREWLVNNAGSMPVEALAVSLGRTTSAVAQQLSSMRVSGRYYRHSMFKCPECGQWRSIRGSRKSQRDVCRVCSRQQVLNDLIETEQDMELALGAPSCEPKSKQDPKPQLKDTRGMKDRYELTKAAIHNAKLLEQWELKNVERAIRSRQRRIERMRADFMNGSN